MTQFLYDVFISYSSKDKAIVREIAERLRKDGIKVWFDEWEIEHRDDRFSKTEEGLEHSRVMVLCLSTNAFTYDWVRLESTTLRFRDPLNVDRRLIPILLDYYPITSWVSRFDYIVRPQNQEQAYEKLLEACRSPSHTSQTGAAYTSAKVLIVGDSGVGKTSLCERLFSGRWRSGEPTVAGWATQWKLAAPSEHGVKREMWLWDFAARSDLPFIHQLYVEDTAVAVLVFDGQKEDPFESLAQWDRYLMRAARRPFAKLLVAARIDVGALRAKRPAIDAFAQRHDYRTFLETSAKTGQGCEELREAITRGISWSDVPITVGPQSLKRLKDEILELKDHGLKLIRFNELRDRLQFSLGDELADDELRAAIGSLAVRGLVWELEFGSYVLLQPEYINLYAQAVIDTVREDELDRGCLPEARLFNGDLTYRSSLNRLNPEDEQIILSAMQNMFVERGLCFRENTDKGPLLIFPGYFRQERPELVSYPPVLMSYQFNGYLDEIYATLVVRLHHTGLFQRFELWRDVADFTTPSGLHQGFRLKRRGTDTGELEVYFDNAIPVPEKIVFTRYTHDHLLKKAVDVVRFRHYTCPHCSTPANHEIAMQRLKAGRDTIICVNCEQRIPLLDELEEYFGSNDIQKRVRELQKQADQALDQASLEQGLVGQIMSTVALAGQISRQLLNSDYGVDMEVEFKDDNGQATAQKLYLQLKAGDSYLRKRKLDSAEIFTIKNERHTGYWMNSPFPVMLVIRTSDGEIRWMEVTNWLKRASDDGKKPVRQIVFEGERFDVTSVRRWRERILRGFQESLEFTAARDPDPNVRLAAIERLSASSADKDARELLEVLGCNDPDERVRLMSIKKLVAAWPDERTTEFLLASEYDPSAVVRIAVYEILSRLWWKDLLVRQRLRELVKWESYDSVKQTLILATRTAGAQVSKYWERRLAGEVTTEAEPEMLPGYPAFRVSRFRLRNIGPFSDTGEVELRKDINIFLGDNAAGKTTMLRCLALAAVGPVAANEVEDSASSYLRKGTQRGIIEVLFEIVPDPDVEGAEAGYFVVALQIVSGSSRFSPASSADITIRHPDLSVSELANGAETLATLRSEGRTQFGFATGYGAIRTFGESRVSLQSELKKRENEWVLSLFEPEAPLVHPEVFAKLVRGDTSNIEASPPRGLSEAMVQMLQKSLRKLFPDVKSFKDDDHSDLELNGVSLHFKDLSEGYRSLMALLGHLLRCSLKIRNWQHDPTQIDGITLVDELDIHLHPAWQVHVADDFRQAFPNLQLIASTHSPLVVAALKKDNVLIMQRQEDGSMLITRPELDPQGLGVAGILTGLFGLSSTIDQPTLDKITRRIELHSQRDNWGDKEKQEYTELTDQLTQLGFNREFSDPYFEQFATAMAKRHRATLEKLTSDQKRELEEFADQLVTSITEGGTL